MASAATVLECEALANFLKGFRSEQTRESYEKKLSGFSEWAGLKPDDIVAIARSDPRHLEKRLLDYAEALKVRAVGGSTIRQAMQAVKHLLVMNDLESSISWSKLSKLMPRARKAGLDRAPTKEEIRKLLEYADVRMKGLILLLASSGVRIGSIEHLKWKHLQEVVYKGQTFAKLLVPVAKGGEAYTTFISPEAYATILEYRRLRESEGERIRSESPLIRVAKWSKAEEKGSPVPASSKALRNELHALWLRAGLREKSKRKPHDVKAVHSFRKFFATRLENAGVGRLIVETLQGHRSSLASNYYKPTDRELLQAYAKGMPELTVSEAAEAKTEMQQRLMEGKLKIAELERENLALQAKLDQFENELTKLKTLVMKLVKYRRKGSKPSQAIALSSSLLGKMKHLTHRQRDKGIYRHRRLLVWEGKLMAAPILCHR
ncbi:MAG: tyrosine-type recombinase/integrase [Candidatus Bathyarchaeia archaeon]